MIRTLHAARPALAYAIGLVVWLTTTLCLLYFLNILMLADGTPARLGLSVFGLGILAIHSAMSIYLADGWKIRFRKLDRENRFIRFLGRFE